MKDFYKILQLEFGASESEIKNQFRKLANTFHPDKNNGSKESEERFKEIMTAYETLSDKGKRFIYDAQLKEILDLKSKQSNNNSDAYWNIYQRQKNSNVRKKQLDVRIIFVIIFVLIIVVFSYVFSKNHKEKTLNDKYKFDKEEQENRPESGEIDFKE